MWIFCSYIAANVPVEELGVRLLVVLELFLQEVQLFRSGAGVDASFVVSLKEVQNPLPAVAALSCLAYITVDQAVHRIQHYQRRLFVKFFFQEKIY